MKKIFTLIAAMAITLTAAATDYTDNLSIEINKEQAGEPAPTTISIDQQSNGKYTIMMKQFSFMGAILVGDVTMTDVEGIDDAEGFTNYATKQTATITNGDETGIMGMLDGKIDVTLQQGSRSKDGKFYAVIDLTVPEVGDVHAVFGDNNFGGSSNINAAMAGNNDKVAAIYTLGGVQVSTMVRGINILKMQSGKTVKVMNNK